MRIAFTGSGLEDLVETLAGRLPGDDVGPAERLGSVDVLLPAGRAVGTAIDPGDAICASTFR